MKRLGILLLSLLLVLAVLTGCGEKKPETTVPGDDAVTDSNGEETLGVPTTANYGDAEFNILSAGNVAYKDFTFEEESTLALDNAQYKRKALVEQNYKVKIHEDTERAYSAGGGPGYVKISTAVNAGDCAYDLALIAGYDVSVLAYSGLLYDLNSVPGIDLSKSWWDQQANKSLAVNDVMFFTTGEITCSDNNSAYVILFNKELQKDYRLESPYDLVESGDWTMDKFAEMCKAVTEDLNQDGVMDENDRFGLLVWDDSILGIVNAAGQRCCTIDQDGTIKLTLYNETTLEALEKYCSIALDTQYAYTYQRKNGYDEKPLWEGNHGLFWTTWLGIVPGFREMESDFGLLPYPKLNKEQENYYTTIAPYLSQFICMPLIQNDLERAGVITEALAYYGKQIVTPAYYDINLVGQSTRDEESEKTLELMFDNLIFDIGYYYRVGNYLSELMGMIRNYDPNFTSRYDSRKSSAQKLLDEINEYYAQAVSSWTDMREAEEE